MQTFTELNKNPNLSLALGFFDGVHLGHRAVIENAVKFAKQNNTKSAVITFKDHPCCSLWGVKPQYILTRQERRQKIEELGVDFLYELDFESISRFSAQDYLKNVLVDNFTPSAISTGWNHNFGYKKSGDTKFLKENSKKYGYEYFELPPVRHPELYKANQNFCHSELVSESSKILCEHKIVHNFNGTKIPKQVRDDKEKEIISSTSIRKYLSEGNIENANQMLGYKFAITGKVVEGNKIGRTIGFKTANIEYPAELIELPYGVYGAKVLNFTCHCERPTGVSQSHYNEITTQTSFARNDKKYRAIANFGTRPTINGNKPVLEVHILDFDEDIYGETITVEFTRMLRPERKFNSLEELKEQIKTDINEI